MLVAGSAAILATAHMASIASAALPDFGRVWAYATIAVTGIITEEATPLVGGLAAHDRAPFAPADPGERERLAVVLMQLRDADLEHPAAMRR